LAQIGKYLAIIAVIYANAPRRATPTLQRNAAYYCLSFARLSLACLFALGRVLTWLDPPTSES